MTKKITHNDLDALALGAALLGSGGGSNPAHGKALAAKAISAYGDIALIDVEDLPADSLIIPVSFMGAPLVGPVKKPSGNEFANLMPFVERYYGRKPTAILAAEIGGSNAFSPLLCAGMLNCPVIDGDTIGRAFPELYMTSAGIHGISNLPTFLASVNGEVITIEALSDLSLEDLTRSITIAFGSKAAIISDIMTGSEAKNVIIRKSYTKALQLGAVILEARNNNTDAVDALIHNKLAEIIAYGEIKEINRQVANGFVIGHFSIETSQGDKLQVHFKNENLLAYRNNILIATTPDIIIPVEQFNGHPLTVEQIEVGKAIALLMLDCDPLWKSNKGLALVDPRACGYNDIGYINYSQKK